MTFKFSWSGLAFALVVLGVIAAIAVPSYGDYTHRAQASEAVSLLGGAKTPLAEYFSDFKKWPRSLDGVVDNKTGKYTQSVAITKGAGGTGEFEMTATMRSENVDRRVAGHSIRMFSTDGGKIWTCRPGTMPEKNLPAACHN